MNERLGTRTRNGSILTRPALDVLGQPYKWKDVSLVPLKGQKERFYVVPVGAKVSTELEDELLSEVAQEDPAPSGPTSDELREAELPAEEIPPRAQRRSKAASEE